jgi:L-ascorbate metabolism protein UlaG (beta-lactamase superfamily)
MKFTYYGHSAFSVEINGITVLFVPNVQRLPSSRISRSQPGSATRALRIFIVIDHQNAVDLFQASGIDLMLLDIGEVVEI